jgi:PAS domain S-box-containing protein
VRSIVGQYTFTQFGSEVLQLMREDKPYIVNDVDRHDPAPEDLSAYRFTQIHAVVCVPLHKGGKFVAAMAVHQATPRVWTADDVELVLQVTNRCWESIERARVARDLQQSEERFRQLANTIPQLAWMAGPDGWITWYNDRWYQYTGTTLEEMLGWGWEKVHDPVELQRMRVTWKAALASGEPWEDVFPLRRYDGEFRWHLSRARPLRDNDGKILLWFGTNTDVTDQRRLAQERESLLVSERAAREEAERVNQMKDEFLATLSHELRTPLNAILGYASLMQMVEMNGPDLAEAISTIERNARLQAQLIEDLLDMNRIISGKIRLDVQDVNLVDVVDEAIAAVKPTAEAKNIALLRVVDAEQRIVRGDPSRLQQVVWNLLSNAIKFTPNGGHVQLVLENVGSQVEILICDSGQGIAPDFLPHVFDRFRQADASSTRRHGGLGLGLAIVRQLVELHGGSVRVNSPGVGLGAEFAVTLPLLIEHHEAVAAEPSPQGRTSVNELLDSDVELLGVRVLVVDDEPDASALVKRVLEQRHAQVERAGSAAEALAQLEQHKFDLIISDIGMPGQDGYQFIRKVRSLENRHRDVPAVALTAFARSEDRKKAALAGFQMHLAKPVEVRKLLAVVANLTKNAG